MPVLLLCTLVLLKKVPIPDHFMMHGKVCEKEGKCIFYELIKR